MNRQQNTSNKTLCADKAEIERFNALATTWWDPDGPMWPLHKLNALRAPFVIESVLKHVTSDADRTSLNGIRILDIGCGAGLLSEAMARAGATVTGVDPAERNIAIAQWHAQQQGLSIEYVCAGIESMRGRRFDVVLNMEVVEHVNDLPAFMRACNLCVDDGGLQIVATLNRTLKAFVFAIVGAEYVLRWLPRGTHHWRKFVKPSEMSALLSDGNLKVIDQAGVAVQPLTRVYRITSDTSVNYMLIAQSTRGDT